MERDNENNNESSIILRIMSVKRALLTSRTIVFSYISAISGYLATNGHELLNQINDTLPQMQSFMNTSVFGWVSFIATISAIYYRIKTKTLVKKKDDIHQIN